jgi:anti-anti-sigma regulatory factor
MTGSSTISMVLRGPTDAELTALGELDAGAVGQVQDLLGTLVAAGVRRVIVDLSAAAGVTGELLEALLLASWTLAERGGWLLVEGADDADPGSALLHAFRAYREAVTAV